MAASHVLRSFASHLRDSEILLRMDNTIAIAYINRMGSVKFTHLSNLARDIWKWCAERRLFIYAFYIPSAQNVEADAESRIISEDTECTLAQVYFTTIESYFRRFDVDLFASAINAKCSHFVSWFPDLLADAVNAFSLCWSVIYFYAFPPFSLILRILRKIITNKAEGISVVPWWPAQPWFPLLKQIIIEQPILFEPNPNMLLSPFRNRHPLWTKISLAAVRLSGKHFCSGEYQRQR